MRFTSYFPALDVLTTQLDSLSKPSRPHYKKNLFSLLIALFMPSLYSEAWREGG